MGLLIDGQWHDKWYDTAKSDGKFVRQESAFRHRISSDPTSLYPAEENRYRLYVSYACPWAHRTLILRELKGLQGVIDVIVVDPLMAEQGWMLDADNPLHTIYTTADPTYSGRVTVPILWDKKTNNIVNNESSDIIRILNSDFNAFATNPELDFYPENLRREIDDINELVYHGVNNGVYKAGFATTQTAYEDAFHALFNSLDQLEERLSTQAYLVGDTLTEADWRLFTTLVRFDAVYVGHFKCNLKRIVDYPNLWNYLKSLYQVAGVAQTVHMDHIKDHYYKSHKTINPTGVVPSGPEIDFLAPHNRDTVTL